MTVVLHVHFTTAMSCIDPCHSYVFIGSKCIIIVVSVMTVLLCVCGAVQYRKYIGVIE